MKEIVCDTNKFEHINIEEDKKLNFLLKSKKKVIDLIKRYKMRVKFQKKNTD